MKALGLSVVVHISNLDNSIKYYTEVLGFTFGFQFGDYAGLYYGEASIHLNGPTNGGQKKEPGNAHFCIDCDEIDDYYKEIKAKGAIVLVPLDNRVYGIRDCAINDLDGNIIVFGKLLDDTKDNS